MGLIGSIESSIFYGSIDGCHGDHRIGIALLSIYFSIYPSLKAISCQHRRRHRTDDDHGTGRLVDLWDHWEKRAVHISRDIKHRSCVYSC